MFGVDIGGTGIKGAPVDLDRGDLAQERLKIATPHPATPEAVMESVHEVVTHFGGSGPLGVTFPGVVVDGVTRTAANVDKGWIGCDARKLLAERLGRPVVVVNDADAAGIAEMTFGAGRGHGGTVIVLTLGTGIGSAVFHDGRLLPNTELGHLELNGHDAETQAAASVRDEHDLSYKKWAKRVNDYMSHVERLFTPDLFVVGGGVSKDSDKWVPLLTLNTPVKPAELLNDAGIVGAAIAAAERLGE